MTLAGKDRTKRKTRDDEAASADPSVLDRVLSAIEKRVAQYADWQVAITPQPRTCSGRATCGKSVKRWDLGSDQAARVAGEYLRARGMSPAPCSSRAGSWVCIRAASETA